MSEEQKSQASPEPAKPAAPAAKTEEPPKPIEPGEYGAMLEKAGVAVKHLGKDAEGTEMVGFEVGSALKGAEFLRDKAQFDMLVFCSGVDWPAKEATEGTRLESVYHVYSLDTHKKITLKVPAQKRGEDYFSPSLYPVWPAADWHERETYDLFGIQYEGHPNLKRILMPDDWLGYPLRKDYKMDDPRLVWNQR